MASRRRFGAKRRKNICTKGQRVKSGHNLVTSQWTGNKTWRKMEDNRVGNK